MKNKLLLGDYIEINTENFESITDRMIVYVSITKGIEPDVLFDMDIDDLMKHYKSCRWVEEPIADSEAKEIIEIGDIKLKKLEFNLISFGQFIDLEHNINNGFVDNIDKIISILYLQFEKKPFEKTQFESYSKVNVNERSEYFRDNLEVNDILGTVREYLKFRQSVFNSYSFFEDGLEDIVYEDLTEEEKKIYDEEIDKMEKSKKTMWEDILALISNEDLTKYEDILGTNVFLVFNRLSKIIADRNKQKNQTKTQ